MEASEAYRIEQITKLLWEADDWWGENKQQLITEADWGECLAFYLEPKLRKIFEVK